MMYMDDPYGWSTWMMHMAALCTKSQSLNVDSPDDDSQRQECQNCPRQNMPK